MLLMIFGQAEQTACRTVALTRASGRSVSDPRAQLGRQVDSQLAYLRDALIGASQASRFEAGTRAGVSNASRPGAAASAKADAAASEPPKRRWKAFLLNSWVVGVATPLIVVAVLAALSGFVSFINGPGGLVTGSVVCESGRPVIGVWIAASAGQRGSGFAHLGPAAGTPGNYAAGSKVTYSYLLASGGSYSVHVGCGGIAADWASSNYSPVLQARSVNLQCNDPTAAHGNSGPPRGACTVTPGT